MRQKRKIYWVQTYVLILLIQFCFNPRILVAQNVQFPIPFSKETPFYTTDKVKVSFDREGNLTGLGKMKVVISNVEVVNKHIDDNGLVKIEKIVDEESKERIPVKVEGYIAFLDGDIFFNPATKINAEHYKKRSIKNSTNGILELKRKYTTYKLAITGSEGLSEKIESGSNLSQFLKKVGFEDWKNPKIHDEIKGLNPTGLKDLKDIPIGAEITYLKNYKNQIEQLGWLQNNLKAKIFYKNGKEPVLIDLIWNKNSKIHSFKRWSKYQFDLVVDDPRFVSLILKWDEWSEITGGNRRCDYNKLSFKHYFLKTDEPFYSYEEVEGSISKDKRIDIKNMKEVRKIYSDTSIKYSKSLSDTTNNDSVTKPPTVKEFISESELVKIPLIIDKRFKREIPASFKGKIAFDGTDVYLDTNSTVDAAHYDTATIKQNVKNLLYMPRKNSQYTISIKGSKLINQSDILSNDIDAKIKTNKTAEEVEINLEWNKELKKHNFDFWTVEPFTLTISDRKFEERNKTITSDNLLLDENRQLELKNIKPNNFFLTINLRGKRSRKITSVWLTSHSEPGNPRQDPPTYKDNTAIAQFVDLDWADAPFTLRATGTNCKVEDRVVRLKRDFKDLQSEGTTDNLTLDVEMKVWSYMENIGFTVVTEKGLPVEGVKVNFIDSSDLPEKLKFSRKSIATDKDGWVVFSNIYDWKNSSIILQKDNEKSNELKLNDKSKIKFMRHGKSRIDYKINSNDLLWK